MNPLVPTAFDLMVSVLYVIVLAYSVAAFISLIRTPLVNGTRFLLWALLVAFVPVIGATLWFVRGRPGAARTESGQVL